MTKTEAIKKYYNRIYNLCLYNTSYKQEDAENCTQEIFIELVLKWDKIKDNCIYSWLLKTTDYKLKNYNRKKKTEAKLQFIDDIDTLPEDSADLSDLIISDSEIEMHKNNILNQLSNEERELYRAYFENNLSFKEISEKLNIKYSTAQMRVYSLKRSFIKRSWKHFVLAESE